VHACGPSSWQAKIGRLWSEAVLRKKYEILPKKYRQKKRGTGSKALSSNPNTEGKKKRKEKEERRNMACRVPVPVSQR
jgi:hypothetical protein